jgi:hypothetical protein
MATMNTTWLDLFHRTTPEAAARIRSTGVFTSLESTGEIFCSTVRDSEHTAGYGSAVIHIRIPVHWARLDDEFELDDGTYEQHFAVPARSLGLRNIVE